MSNWRVLSRPTFTDMLESVLPRSKKQSPPSTHNSAPIGAASKQGSSNDVGRNDPWGDWGGDDNRPEFGGSAFYSTITSIRNKTMKIHNVSDKFVKVHGKGLARAVANLLSKPSYSYMGSIVSIWLHGNITLIDFESHNKPTKVNHVEFELTRNPQTHELELTPADEESLLLIQEWEELNKDAYNDQAIY